MAYAYDPRSGEFSLYGAVAALTGRDASAFQTPADLLAIVHPEDRKDVLQPAHRIDSDTGTASVRFRILHPDDSHIACVLQGDPLVDGGTGFGARFGLINPCRDRAPALDRARRLAELTEYLPELVSLHSTTGQTLSINAGGRRLLGLDRDDDVSRLMLSDLVGDSSTVPAHLLISVILAHGSHSSDVVLFNQREATQIHAYWSGTVIGDHKERIIVCIARDMTHQLKTEWELRENQRRLTHALDVSQLGEWSMDINTQTGRQSPRVADIFGDGLRSEWNYRVFLSHVHPEDRARVERLFRKSMETARDLDFEARVVRRDGGHRWISAKASMTRGLRGDGQIIGGVIQDITERKFTEQRNRLLADLSRPLATFLDESRMLREVMQLIVPTLGDIASFDLFDADQHLLREVASNSLLSRDAIGDPRTHVNQLPETAARSLARGEAGVLTVSDTRGLEDVARTESELLSLHGLDVNAFLCVPLKVRERPIGFINLYRISAGGRFTAEECNLAVEIGLRVSVALENARLYRALRENDSRKNEFMAMLSHELRNPLESLDAGVSLYEHDDKGQGQSGATSIMMRRQIDKLSSLLDDLLDLSRYAIDKVVLRRSQLALQPLIEGVVADYQARRGAEYYEWKLSMPESPVYVHADAVRLSQVMGNLLANAVKYGSSRGTIAISVTTQDVDVSIRVSDEGVGIAQEQLPSVFDLFVQGATTIDRGRGGLGMGLTLVKKIVELHGGIVTAHSDGVGQGSEFEVRLKAQEAPPIVAASEQAPIKQVNGERLLLVDDNLETVGALAKLFLRLGYNVRIGHDGLDAIQLAKEFKPRLAVLDIGLPGASGYEVARALREQYQGEPLLLIALSGYGQQQDRERSQEAGFDHHILKPANFRSIAKLIEQSLT